MSPPREPSSPLTPVDSVIPAPSPHDQWWRPPLSFLLEMLVGMFVFGAVAAVTVLTSRGVRYLEHSDPDIDIFILNGLKAAEYGVFLADLVLFARFIWRALQKTWKSL